MARFESAGVSGLSSGRASVALALADCRLQLMLGEKPVVDFSYEPADGPPRQPTGEPFSIGAVGGPLWMGQWSISRDIYYLPPPGEKRDGGSPVSGPTEYWLLGDNSAVSADSRTWPADVRITRDGLVGTILQWRLKTVGRGGGAGLSNCRPSAFHPKPAISTKFARIPPSAGRFPYVIFASPYTMEEIGLETCRRLARVRAVFSSGLANDRWLRGIARGGQAHFYSSSGQNRRQSMSSKRSTTQRPSAGPTSDTRLPASETKVIGKSATPGKRVPAGATQRTIRETIESIVVAFVLAFLFRTFEAEAFVIPTGSMAPTLQGRHKDLICPKCGTHYRVSASSEVGDDSQADSGEAPPKGVVEGTCPNCRYHDERRSGRRRGHGPTTETGFWWPSFPTIFPSRSVGRDRLSVIPATGR